jgi:hypothetical protein
MLKVESANRMNTRGFAELSNWITLGLWLLEEMEPFRS